MFEIKLNKLVLNFLIVNSTQLIYNSIHDKSEYNQLSAGSYDGNGMFYNRDISACCHTEEGEQLICI